MDQPELKPGDFAAFLNLEKSPGDGQHMFRGHISDPGTTAKKPIRVWANEYTDPKTGEVKMSLTYRIGETASSLVAPGMTAGDQIAALARAAPAPDPKSLLALTHANISVTALRGVLFPNAFKEEAPEKNRPDFWGPYNNGTALYMVGAWLGVDKNGHAYLSGKTSVHRPGKSDAELQDAAAADLEELSAKGKVTKGMPGKKGRSSRGV